MEVLKNFDKKYSKKIHDIKYKGEKKMFGVVEPDSIRDVALYFFNQLKLRFIALTCIDEKGFFELIYHFSADKTGVQLNLRVKLSKVNASIKSIADIVYGACWAEREIIEMYGVNFIGMENAGSLLLSKDHKIKKYPLRKNA
jgi:NADH:ubiquinone oxidoreductase subunit C